MFKWSTECGGFYHFLIACEYLIILFSPKGDLDNITNMIWRWRIFRKTNNIFLHDLNFSYLIEYRYSFLNIFL